MSVRPVTRRRLLLSGVLAVGLAGCSGASDDGATETDDSETDAASTDASGTTRERDVDSAEPPATAGDSADGDTTSDRSGPDIESTGRAETETTSSADDLDLREANVVDVALSVSGGSYRFDVTLYHDDDGEDGYANWWQVETLDGQRLGRRELLHAHSTAPFTRSETISIPDGTTHVVVRGHDQTHGYGGQALVVNVDTGAMEPVRQGPEPREFSGFEPSV